MSASIWSRPIRPSASLIRRRPARPPVAAAPSPRSGRIMARVGAVIVASSGAANVPGVFLSHWPLASTARPSAPVRTRTGPPSPSRKDSRVATLPIAGAGRPMALNSTPLSLAVSVMSPPFQIPAGVMRMLPSTASGPAWPVALISQSVMRSVTTPLSFTGDAPRKALTTCVICCEGVKRSASMLMTSARGAPRLNCKGCPSATRLRSSSSPSKPRAMTSSTRHWPARRRALIRPLPMGPLPIRMLWPETTI